MRLGPLSGFSDFFFVAILLLYGKKLRLRVGREEPEEQI